MSNQVEVIAVKKGFLNGIREEGQTFFVDAELISDGAWFKPVEPPEKTEVKLTSSKKLAELEALADEKGVTRAGTETKAELLALLAVAGVDA